MFLLYQFGIFLNSALIFLLLGAIFLWPNYFYIWMPLVVLLALAPMKYILKEKESKWKDKLMFAVSPFMLSISSLAASMLIENYIMKLIFSIGISLIIYLYLINLFLYYWASVRYQIYSLENISSYMNLIAIFLLVSSFYGFRMLLGLRTPWVIAFGLILALAVYLLLYQTVWINKLSSNDGKTHILISALILMEFYAVILLLPTEFFVNGLIFALAYYIISGLIRFKLLNKLEKSTMIKYVAIGFSMFLLLILTAKWI